MIQNNLSLALKKITRFLYGLKIPYMVIGGIANSIFGEPRFTYDIDIKLKLLSQNDLSLLINSIKKEFEIRTENPEEFIQKFTILPISSEGVNIDLIFAYLPYEEKAIENAIEKEFDNIKIKVCKPEDLIIQKSVSRREKDWIDIIGVVNRNRENLDWGYLFKTLKELSEWFSDNKIYERIADLKDGK